MCIQRGELGQLGLEKDTVIFAPQIPVALYSMGESAGQLVVRKEWGGYSAEFHGEEWIQILTGKSQSQGPDICFQGVRQSRPTWRVWRTRQQCGRGWTLDSQTVRELHWGKGDAFSWEIFGRSLVIFQKLSLWFMMWNLCFTSLVIVNIFIILLYPIVRLEFPWIWFYTASSLGEEGLHITKVVR